MKKKLRTILCPIVLAIATVSTLNAFAIDPSIGLSNLGDLTQLKIQRPTTSCHHDRCTDDIDNVYVSDGNEVLVSTAGDARLLQCEPTESRFLLLQKSHPQFDEIYSLLLGAKLANQKVSIRVHYTPQEPCVIKNVML